MAAPKNPNPGPAAAKNARKGQETKAQALRAAGWWTLTPEQLIELRAWLHDLVKELGEEQNPAGVGRECACKHYTEVIRTMLDSHPSPESAEDVR